MTDLGLDVKGISQTSPSAAPIIPGLPDEVVFTHILPRLPWYVRPAASLVSTIWKLRLEDADLGIQTQVFQAAALEGAVVLWKRDEDNLVILEAGGTRRALPPLPPRSPKTAVHTSLEIPKMVASKGMIIAWRHSYRFNPHQIDLEDVGDVFLAYKLDLQRGRWKWETLYDMMFEDLHDAVAYDGKMYFNWRNRNLVYDMDTGASSCLGDGWTCNAIVVTDRIYGLWPKLDESCEIMAYDPWRNAWDSSRTIRESLGFPVILPVYDGCFRLEWRRPYCTLSMRYMPKCKMEWVLLESNPPARVRNIRFSIRSSNGFMYAFSDQRDLWKGRIDIDQGLIAWEEIHVSSDGELLDFGLL